MRKCPLIVNSRNKAACLDEGQQKGGEDEREGVSTCSMSVQPKLTTISKAMLSLEYVSSLGCTPEAKDPSLSHQRFGRSTL